MERLASENRERKEATNSKDGTASDLDPDPVLRAWRRFSRHSSIKACFFSRASDATGFGLDPSISNFRRTPMLLLDSVQ